MSRTIEVTLTAYEPLGVDPEAQQPWSDTYVDAWLGWRRLLRGKSPRLRIGPTICGVRDLESEIEWERGLASDRPDLFEPEEFAELEAAKRAMVRGEPYYFEDLENNTPTIYVPSLLIDRAAAEAAVRGYLEKFYGLRRLRFRWAEIEGPVATPCSLPSGEREG